METLDIGGMDRLKVIELVKLIGIQETKDMLVKARQTEKDATALGIAFKVSDADVSTIADQLEALAAQLRGGVQVEMKRSDPAAQHTPAIGGLTAQKSYNPATDFLSRALGADQVTK